MLVYDAEDRAATAQAERLAPRLPTGYPVVAVRDLPPAGVLPLTPDDVRGTLVWVDADGTCHRGRAGVARALAACGGMTAVTGRLARLPLIGGLLTR